MIYIISINEQTHQKYKDSKNAVRSNSFVGWVKGGWKLVHRPFGPRTDS